ncbi:3-hydroxyacyl-CoA dehydrogenase NAD-binding domain-containing protein [Streptomyces litchfieldiae]|uniref:3-hydroxyacyl-CoA dehydrogenase NAD-binding domain-containing protein n=1 Tax=Streptomyces litchfieldiae TaxID=3075543 RepID=A0ABU2MTE2_9ACTN|nr:3-hydroxyacyl-CoA dehydrogenase NAD-binding domain-containing protein [Streptomyces sp. DSM 44938]MDT0344339.1 3-hydroxyacyl-CoA dehydrogenase NAD-binding domain-containing protein [Streptomyces sp. DSM 44938]
MPESTPPSGPIRWHRGADDIVTLTLDDPGQSHNTMNAAFIDALTAAADRLEAERDTLTGVIVTSAKKTFFAGGDLHDLLAAGPEDAQRVFDTGMRVKRALRRIETLGRPVVAALNGSALGGGLEIALACHHRVALDRPDIRFGLPEVTLGLLPGGGGVVRTVRLLGIVDALSRVLLEGRRHRPAAARELGLVHEVVDTPDALLARARAFIAAHPDARQPWDVSGHRIPGGTPAGPALMAVLPALPATLAKRTGGAPYPAPRNILAAAVEGAQVGFETAEIIEARYFTELVVGQTAKNMIQAFFFDLKAVNSGAARPKDVGEHPAARVAVLGAGLMGAGIAYVCASAGLDVVLKDVTPEAAARGKVYSADLLASAVAAGRTTGAERDAVLARITPTAEVADLAGCDVVIEAVFEDPGLKQKVFQEVQAVVAPDALLCTNTSTLPIGQLAEAVQRRRDFIGLHFFWPADRRTLVEIVKGADTGPEALARAIDLVRRLGKTPIVVNDSRGFFTSHVIGRFLKEALIMLAEGVDPVSLEQAARQAGYPTPALALLDELSLTLPRKIWDEVAAAAEAEGETWEPGPAEAVLDRMLNEFRRSGRGAGAGFYEYEDGRRGGLWPGLRTHFARPGVTVPFADIQERLLFAEALDAVQLLEDGVLTSVADANVGSLLGIGFPGWTGGVLQYVNGYAGGPAGFTARARELRDRYGDRFEPPALLVTTAERGATFTD